jgi:rhodanese-related sulfurtransferase
MSEVPAVPVEDVGPQTVLLDVREQDEWDAGHAPGAQHLPATELMARYGEVPVDCEVHVICRTGRRSAAVAQWLNQEGFEAVNVVGGMDAWVQAGRPLVAENGQTPRVL